MSASHIKHLSFTSGVITNEYWAKLAHFRFERWRLTALFSALVQALDPSCLYSTSHLVTSHPPSSQPLSWMYTWVALLHSQSVEGGDIGAGNGTSFILFFIKQMGRACSDKVEQSSNISKQYPAWHKRAINALNKAIMPRTRQSGAQLLCFTMPVINSP